MKKSKENLNEYSEAYTTNFKYYDENLYYLGHYAKNMGATLRLKKYESILSLGIGKQIVSKTIQKELSHFLKRHLILDGSADVIAAFNKENKNNRSKTLLTYFEDFETEERFDCIEMGFILEHVDSPELVVRKYRGYLKNQGTLFVAVPNARSLHRLIGYEAGLLDDLYKLGPYDLQLGHKRYFDLEKICNLLETCGFNITRRMGLMLKPITADQMQKLEFSENIMHALLKMGEGYPEMANCIYLEAQLAN